MRVWVDITNSPHVLVFRPLIRILRERGHEVDVTAREYALVEFLAAILETSRSQIALVKGQTARHKTIRISGLSAPQVLAKLQPHLA